MRELDTTGYNQLIVYALVEVLKINHLGFFYEMHSMSGLGKESKR